MGGSGGDRVRAKRTLDKRVQKKKGKIRTGEDRTLHQGMRAKKAARSKSG